MAIGLVTVICSKCDQPMKLPQHVADLPADARLCGACVQEMVHGLRVDRLEAAQARYIRAHSAVVNSFDPTQEQWDELDAAATEYNEAEQRGMAEEDKVKYEITKNCLGIVENTVFETDDLAKAEARLDAYLSGDEAGEWTLWEIDEAGNDRLVQSVSVGEPITVV